MKMFDLNFWQEPDWRRESTINPNFLMVVIVTLVLILAGWLITHTHRVKGMATEELGDIEAQHAEIKETAEEIKEFRQLTSFWQSKLEELQEEEKRKIIVSRQLEALQQLVPSEIIIQSFRLNLNEVEVDNGSSDDEKEEKFQYRLDLTGTAGGENPQKIITDFAARLRPGSDNMIGRNLQSYELKQISGESGRGEGEEKKFTIECIYQPR